jgi:uncharacterized protein (TIGR03435 family)
MLQTLLEDRFHLKIHRETEEIPIYALTVAASGLNLKPMEDGACIEPNTTARSPQLPAPDEKPECPLISNGKNGLNAPSGPNGPNWSYDFVGESLSEFANQLTLHLDRRVIDKTGVTGRFSFNVEFARDENAPGPTLPDGVPLFAPPPTEPTTPGPSIFTALRHLGLMLEPTKGPREYIVIDQVERPSEN